MPYDEQGLYFPDTNPIGDALSSGNAFPALSDTATAADRDLYTILQQVASGGPDVQNDLLPALINGNLWIGNTPNQNYPQGGILGQSVYDAYATGQIQDPNLQLYVQQLLNNANRRDAYSPWGDQFTTALLGLGLATGGAAAYGGFAAPATGGAASAAPAFTAVGSDFAPFASTLGAAYGPEAALGTALEGFTGLSTAASGLSSAEGASAAPGLLDQLKTLGATPIFEGGPTYSQALQGLSLANSAANVAQNPSGGGIGGLAGVLLGAYTGIPGLGVAGQLTGNLAGGGGGQGVAETARSPLYNDDGSVNWLALLPSLIGLGGAGIGLAGAFGTQGQAQDTYQRQLQSYAQQQALYQLLLNLAQQNTANAGAYNAQLPTINQEQQQVFQQLQQFANQNLNPANVAAGAKAFQQQIPDDVLRSVQRDLAMRGQSDGGAASDATATVLARIAPQLQAQAVNQYLNSQQLGLSALRNPAQPLPPASLSAGYPQVPSAPGLGQVPGYGYGAQTLGSTVGSTGKIIADLVKLFSANPDSTSGVDSGLYNFDTIASRGTGGGAILGDVGQYAPDLNTYELSNFIPPIGGSLLDNFDLSNFAFQ